MHLSGRDRERPELRLGGSLNGVQNGSIRGVFTRFSPRIVELGGVAQSRRGDHHRRCRARNRRGELA